jgi:hypothetical protein
MRVVVSTQFEREGVINRGDLPPGLQLNTEYEPLVHAVNLVGRARLSNSARFNSNY